MIGDLDARATMWGGDWKAVEGRLLRRWHAIDSQVRWKTMSVLKKKVSFFSLSLSFCDSHVHPHQCHSIKERSRRLLVLRENYLPRDQQSTNCVEFVSIRRNYGILKLSSGSSYGVRQWQGISTPLRRCPHGPPKVPQKTYLADTQSSVLHRDALFFCVCINKGSLLLKEVWCSNSPFSFCLEGVEWNEICMNGLKNGAR